MEARDKAEIYGNQTVFLRDELDHLRARFDRYHGYTQAGFKTLYHERRYGPARGAPGTEDILDHDSQWGVWLSTRSEAESEAQHPRGAARDYPGASKDAEGGRGVWEGSHRPADGGGVESAHAGGGAMVGTRTGVLPCLWCGLKGTPLYLGDSGVGDDKNYGTRLMEVLGGRALRGRGGLWVFERKVREDQGRLRAAGGSVLCRSRTCCRWYQSPRAHLTCHGYAIAVIIFSARSETDPSSKMASPVA
jgi:hypothetical protein